MSKSYRVDMKIDVSKLHPSGGILLRAVPKEKDEKKPEAEFDPRGFREQTGPEVFVMLSAAAIQSANPKGSYDQIKGFRGVIKKLEDSVKSGEFEANKTQIDVIKHSIAGHPSWPNTDELLATLNSIMGKLDNAQLVE